MKNTICITLMLLAIIAGSCSKGEVDFSYTPAEPRCGQTITFRNSSTKGDSDSEWQWVFGDGATSTLNSPSKVYKDAGVYMVTLTLDGKNHQRASKEITVYDSIPTFTASIDQIGTYKQVTFTTLTYNPYGKAVEYKWILPEDAVITDSTETTITLYFRQAADKKEITLITNLGGEETTKTIAYQVVSTPASSIIMITEKGELLRQKIYRTLIADVETIDLQGIDLDRAKQLLVHENTLFIFCPSNGDDGAIYAYDLEATTLSVVIHTTNALANRLYTSGMIGEGYLYFTDEGNNNIYRINVNERNLTFDEQYLWTAASSLTGFTSGNGIGVAKYADLYYLSAENGIYRFLETDINSNIVPLSSLISTEVPPANLLIDHSAGKVYTIEAGNLIVRNVDGTYPVILQEGLPQELAVALSSSLNRIVYYTQQGVVSMPLIRTYNNTTTATTTLLNEEKITTIAIDQTER